MNTTAAISNKTTGFALLMHNRQIPLADKYREAPEQAWVVDIASTGKGTTHINDPLHSSVTTGGVTIPMGVHPAVGGNGDAPNPGEILSAALASCMDSAIRIVANRLSIVLTHLEVLVSAEVDVRGTLRLNPEVPVAFQKLHLSVQIQTLADTKPAMVSALLHAAETSCIVLQTLRNPPAITTQFNTDCEQE